MFSTELLNRNQLTNVIPDNSDWEAELLSVIILQDFQNCSLVSTSVKHPPRGPFELVFLTHLNNLILIRCIL